jgi:hypothetical protein
MIAKGFFPLFESCFMLGFAVYNCEVMKAEVIVCCHTHRSWLLEMPEHAEMFRRKLPENDSFFEE